MRSVKLGTLPWIVNNLFFSPDFPRKANDLIKGQGRILVRKSGTEPKIRIMGESKNKVLLKKCIKIISRTIK